MTGELLLTLPTAKSGWAELIPFRFLADLVQVLPWPWSHIVGFGVLGLLGYVIWRAVEAWGEREED
ncbi:MAG TPA: hypothetical protein VIL65_11005 [Beijerinckiaceae bacterium]|jgi:hypothetical protein